MRSQGTTRASSQQQSVRHRCEPANDRAGLKVTQESGGGSRGRSLIYGRKLTMHFRVLDLAAERSVWSVPPIDTVPFKLRGEKLVVRSFDVNANLIGAAPIDGADLGGLVQRLFGDRHVTSLHIHLATDGSYAGHAVRFDKPNNGWVPRND
jgi:Protein of unknown function (DUF1203)